MSEPTTTDDICARYNAGASTYQIAAATGLTQATVWRILTAAGTQMRHTSTQRSSDPDGLTSRERQVTELTAKGRTVDEICHETGLSRSWVHQLRSKARRRTHPQPTGSPPAPTAPVQNPRPAPAAGVTPAGITDTAIDLAFRLQDSDDPAATTQEILEELRRWKATDLRLLAATLAALVDVDRTRSQMLAWCGGRAPVETLADLDALPKPAAKRTPAGPGPVCPSEAAYRAHLAAGVDCPDGVCRPHMARVEAARRRKHPEWAANGRQRFEQRAQDARAHAAAVGALGVVGPQGAAVPVFAAGRTA